jgi:hypothetical protein
MVGNIPYSDAINIFISKIRNNKEKLLFLNIFFIFDGTVQG